MKLTAALLVLAMTALTVRSPDVTADGLYWSSEVTATTLPVDPWAGSGFRTVARVVTGPLSPGDVVDADGAGRAETSLPYKVGVGVHLWGYDVDHELPLNERPWWRLGPSFGDNVDRSRKYLPFAASGVWVVPDGWPAGHRLTVVLRADAHSTAAQPGDRVAVGVNGWVRVRVWSRPVADVDGDRDA